MQIYHKFCPVSRPPRHLQNQQKMLNSHKSLLNCSTMTASIVWAMATSIMCIFVSMLATCAAKKKPPLPPPKQKKIEPETKIIVAGEPVVINRIDLKTKSKFQLQAPLSMRSTRTRGFRTLDDKLPSVRHGREPKETSKTSSKKRKTQKKSVKEHKQSEKEKRNHKSEATIPSEKASEPFERRTFPSFFWMIIISTATPSPATARTMSDRPSKSASVPQGEQPIDEPTEADSMQAKIDDTANYENITISWSLNWICKITETVIPIYHLRAHFVWKVKLDLWLGYCNEGQRANVFDGRG